jgi:hypothetical protein
MNRGISGDNTGVLDPDRPSGQIGYYAAGLSNHEAARGYIPGRELLLPKPLEPASGDVSQVECSGSRTPDPTRSGGNSTELPLICLQARHVSEGKPGTDKGELGIANFRNVEPSLTQPRSAATGGRVRLTSRHMIDDSGLENAIHCGGDRDGILGEPVEKVCGPVQRVDDPDYSFLHHRRAQLLGNDTRSGRARQEQLRDDLFGGPVDLGHEIATALERPSGMIDLRRGAANVRRGTPGGGAGQMQ